jgi:cell division septal protein FtsQ
VTELHSQWAETTWEQLVKSRGRRNRKRGAALAIMFVSLAGLVLLGFMLRGQLASTSAVVIHEIEISGNRSVSSAEILDILAVRAQDPWWTCRPEEIRRRANLHPRLASLTLHYGWFHRLQVKVVEREPALAVLSIPSGEITRDGWFLPPQAAGDESDLPILRPAPGTLPSPGGRVDRRMADVARLIGDLRTRRPAIWRDLSEIDLASDSDARAYLRSRRGVILFTPGVHEDLWGRLPAVLDDLERHNRTDIVLDLRFPDRIVVHLPEAVTPDTVSAAGAARERI